jgi:hypothetical protein
VLDSYLMDDNLARKAVGNSVDLEGREITHIRPGTMSPYAAPLHDG